jgi:hypothetical protein
MSLRRCGWPAKPLPYHMNLIRWSFASEPVVAKATLALRIGASAARRSASSITTGTVRWAAEGYMGSARICALAASISSSSLNPREAQ